MDTAKFEIEPELKKGEQLLWSGRPKQGVIMHPVDYALVPFGVIFAGVALFWISYAISDAIMHGEAGGTICLAIGSAPFGLLAIYILLFRFLFDAWRRARTFYGVTSDRIIVITGVFFRRTISFDLRTVTDIALDAWDNRRGTIVFGPLIPAAQAHGGVQWMNVYQYGRWTFESIADARSVFELICSTRRKYDQTSYR